MEKLWKAGILWQGGEKRRLYLAIHWSNLGFIGVVIIRMINPGALMCICVYFKCQMIFSGTLFLGGLTTELENSVMDA